MFNVLVPRVLLAGLVCALSFSAAAQDAQAPLLTEAGEVVDEEARSSQAEHPQYDSEGNLVQETQQGEVVDYEVQAEDSEGE